MLDGYRPGMTAADPLFRLMLLQHAVCHVALLAERRVPLVDAAYRWYLRRRWQLCERIAGWPGDAGRLAFRHSTRHNLNVTAGRQTPGMALLSLTCVSKVSRTMSKSPVSTVIE